MIKLNKLITSMILLFLILNFLFFIYSYKIDLPIQKDYCNNIKKINFQNPTKDLVYCIKLETHEFYAYWLDNIIIGIFLNAFLCFIIGFIYYIYKEEITGGIY